MKKTAFILLLAASVTYAQFDVTRPENAIYKNFKPFPTPRTNYRPGTVYRIDINDVQFVVQDVKSIKSMSSNEGTVKGRIMFTRDEILENLNIEFDMDYVNAEVEIKDAVCEFTEQSNIDNVLWENDVAENLLVDDSSKYYIVRETVLAKEITYRFNKESFEKIVAGKINLKEKTASGDQQIEYPFSITKKFKEPKRLFYLDQEVSDETYSGGGGWLFF